MEQYQNLEALVAQHILDHPGVLLSGTNLLEFMTWGYDRTMKALTAMPQEISSAKGEE